LTNPAASNILEAISKNGYWFKIKAAARFNPERPYKHRLDVDSAKKGFRMPGTILSWSLSGIITSGLLRNKHTEV